MGYAGATRRRNTGLKGRCTTIGNAASQHAGYCGAMSPEGQNERHNEYETSRYLRQSRTPIEPVCCRRPFSARYASPARQWISCYPGARTFVGSLPKVDWLLGDHGHDADCFREVSKDKRICASIPGQKQRKTTARCDKRSYKRRNRVGIMFGRPKDCRRFATRHDSCSRPSCLQSPPHSRHVLVMSLSFS